MTTDMIGLYVHIPFCVRKCRYCDFCSGTPTGDDIERYIDSLEAECRRYYKDARPSVDTVFFGGGTPSILSTEQFSRVFKIIENSFDLSSVSELTVEVNPGTVTREKAELYRSLGINRISIGLQSIHENELKMLGRIHSYSDFLATYGMFSELGFLNISVDLMYGIPEQTKDSFRQTLRSVVALSPKHISAYGLIVEPGTPFYEMRESLPLPDEDTERDMYDLACGMLGDAGYSHYEISNYARPGAECKHNLKYWRCEEYIGIGAAAHSYYLGTRFENSCDVPNYNRVAGIEIFGEDAAYEYAMMRLRLREGICLSEYRERFGVDFTLGKEKILSEYERMGLLVLEDDRLYLSEAGFYLSNSVLVSIL